MGVLRGQVNRLFPFFALFLAASSAAEPPTCPPDDGHTATSTRLLRTTSLDLRGIVPDLEDYESASDGGVPESVLDNWLASPEFTQQVVRHHQSLFWNNVEPVDIVDADSRLRDEDDIWYIDDNPSLVRRGINDGHCGDFPTVFDAYDRPVALVQPDGSLQEGWVWVNPYWDPETPIRVCAFDAAEREFTQSGTDCKSRDAEFDPECGCGPELRWCRINGLEEDINLGFGSDIDRRVARLLDEDRSYLDLFQDDVGFVNGPMVHFYRHLTGKSDDVDFAPGQVDLARLPDLDFLDADTYVEVDLGAQHSGVLTSPAWLMRFQTNRGRANRFYNSFLCQPFQPPDGGLTALDDPNPSLDLTKRDGCAYCHALLEPAAAHWGRWPEAGAGHLGALDYPAFDADCEACAMWNTSCSERCDDHYLVDPIATEEFEYLGWLLSYEFLEDRYWPNVEEGPELLVAETVTDGRLPECVATRAAEWLLGREMEDADRPWIEDLSDHFVASDFRYRELVKEIVTSDNYRRVP